VTQVIHPQGHGLSNLLYPLGTIKQTVLDHNFIWSLEKLHYSCVIEEITGVLR